MPRVYIILKWILLKNAKFRRDEFLIFFSQHLIKQCLYSVGCCFLLQMLPLLNSRCQCSSTLTVIVTLPSLLLLFHSHCYCCTTFTVTVTPSALLLLLYSHCYCYSSVTLTVTFIVSVILVLLSLLLLLFRLLFREYLLSGGRTQTQNYEILQKQD